MLLECLLQPQAKIPRRSGLSAASSLCIGNAVVTRAGPDLVVKSISAEAHREGVAVHNFTVDADHAYFVGTAFGGPGYITIAITLVLVWPNLRRSFTIILKILNTIGTFSAGSHNPANKRRTFRLAPTLP
jgi:hypothetical protein